jgi:uncharacterized protein YwgA/O-acetyl-ADP-ribose deacetylase (regulator of RNase III)
MVRVLIGDMFESRSQTLVNTVNCVGVMGKGLALEFKKRFPDMYEDYVVRCQAKKVKLGEPYLYVPLLPPLLLNFPTKDHWRSVSRISDIIAGMDYLERHYKEWGITSLAMPALGCSNGQLEWRIVGPILYQHLSRFDIPIELYAPLDTPQEQMAMAFLSRAVPLDSTTSRGGGESERVPAAWIVLVEILQRITVHRYRWPVGRTTFQKIVYFATMLGLPTGQEFRRGSYGPFAPELKRLETRMVNNGLLQEEPLGQMFSIMPGTAYSYAIQSYAAEITPWENLIQRVTDLFLRMQTSEAEVAATVHLAAAELMQLHGGTVSEIEILEAVKEWKQRRKPPINDKEIAETIRALNLLGWIDAHLSDTLPLDDPELMEA